MINIIWSYILSWSYILPVIGFIFYAIGYFLPPIPTLNQYKLPAKVIGILIFMFGIFMVGRNEERKDWEEKLTEARLEIASLEAQSSDINTKVITQFVTAKTEVDNKQQPVGGDSGLVPPSDDKKCNIDRSYLRLDEAIVNQKSVLPDVKIDDDPTNIKLSDVAEAEKVNYHTYYKVSEQLKALQSWVNQQKSLWDSKKNFNVENMK